MITLIALLAVLSGIVWRVFAAGAAAQDLKARYADEKREADDARAIATFQQRSADAERRAALERERLAVADPDALARAAERLLNDAQPGGPGADAAPPRA